SEPQHSFATDGHFWNPVHTLKVIFDELGIPQTARVYALSFFERRRCSLARGLPCVDADPHSWADQTLQGVNTIVGTGARVVAPEMGWDPGDPTWRTEYAVESLTSLMETYGVQGGSFWRWGAAGNNEDG